jgi:hypothetical protein
MVLHRVVSFVGVVGELGGEVDVVFVNRLSVSGEGLFRRLARGVEESLSFDSSLELCEDVGEA